MRKISKILLCILLLVITVGSFSACIASKEEKAVKKVVEEYIAAIKEMDFDKALSFVDEESEFYKETKDNADGTFYMEWGEMMARSAYMDESYATDIATLFKKLTEENAKNLEISIDKVTVSEDKKSAEVKCVGKTVDNDVFGDAISMETFKKIAEEMYGKKVLEDEELYKVFEEQYKRAAENLEITDLNETVKLVLKGEEWKISEISEVSE